MYGPGGQIYVKHENGSDDVRNDFFRLIFQEDDEAIKRGKMNKESVYKRMYS